MTTLQRAGDAKASPGLTLFDQASRVFDGWTDSTTGMTVLRVQPPRSPQPPGQLNMPYHQTQPFSEGGRMVLLRSGRNTRVGRAHRPFLLNLTTGELTSPFPIGSSAMDQRVDDATSLLSLRSDDGHRIVLWDRPTAQILATFRCPEGWRTSGAARLSDPYRFVVTVKDEGKPYDEPVNSRIYVVGLAGQELIHEAPGFFCNHAQGCPTDPDLFAYDRWPCPKLAQPAPQVIHLMRTDGGEHRMLPLNGMTVRPGNLWGGQRDHYLWTPDGRYITSYFVPGDVDFSHGFNHFDFGWWVSATDWRTGEDLAAPYPPGRWGCNFQVTPDGRHIVSGGGPGYDWLYAIDIEGLRRGWNQTLICAYPPNHWNPRGGPFTWPFVLPDGSGVLFNAGWPGESHGLYLAQWPGL